LATFISGLVYLHFLKTTILKNIKPVDKITALWALSEAGLGGVFHAFRVPFTGLIIAGVSILFISLIAKLSDNKLKNVLKSMLIVLIIKMIISPHTPPTAYLALSFQGVLGFALFYLFGINRVSILLLALLALIESGFQKILTLTIFYGVSIWESIDSFYKYLVTELRFLPELSGTQFLLIIYLAIYCLSAILFASISIGILGRLEQNDQDLIREYYQYVSKNDPKGLNRKKKKNLIGRRAWLLIILLMIISVLLLFSPEMGWQQALYIFLRSILVILLWYIAIAPFFKYLFERFLKKQKVRFSAELSFVLGVFPTLRSIASFGIKKNGPISSLQKLKHFFEDIIYLTLNTELPSDGKNSDIDRDGQKW
jgi:hypothetical protein